MCSELNNSNHQNHQKSRINIYIGSQLFQETKVAKGGKIESTSIEAETMISLHPIIHEIW